MKIRIDTEVVREFQAACRKMRSLCFALWGSSRPLELPKTGALFLHSGKSLTTIGEEREPSYV